MANERALGISFVCAAQTRPQLFGDQEAGTLLGLTNTLTLSGSSKDIAFNQEISDLLGPVRVARTSGQTGNRSGRLGVECSASAAPERRPRVDAVVPRSRPPRLASRVPRPGRRLVGRRRTVARSSRPRGQARESPPERQPSSTMV
ncbi:hypothetical protein GCM10009826_41130 [Humibacillus xanthopallidus]